MCPMLKKNFYLGSPRESPKESPKENPEESPKENLAADIRNKHHND